MSEVKKVLAVVTFVALVALAAWSLDGQAVQHKTLEGWYGGEPVYDVKAWDSLQDKTSFSPGVCACLAGRVAALEAALAEARADRDRLAKAARAALRCVAPPASLTNEARSVLQQALKEGVE